jgi:hypothetical protein
MLISIREEFMTESATFKRGQERARQELAMKMAKTSIGAQVNAELWTRFKIRCLEKGVTAGDMLTQLISDFLQKDR